MFKIVIHHDVLNTEFAKHIGRGRGADYIDNLVINQFETSKKELIKEFVMHEVSQELSKKNGPLWGFIGMEKGSSPVQDIIFLLEDWVDVEYIRYDIPVFRRIYRVSVPSREAITRAGSLPWAPGLSWVFGIEEGISGINRFIHLRGKGRSGSGLQLQNDIPLQTGLGFVFKTREYLPSMLLRFLAIFGVITK